MFFKRSVVGSLALLALSHSAYADGYWAFAIRKNGLEWGVGVGATAAAARENAIKECEKPMQNIRLLQPYQSYPNPSKECDIRHSFSVDEDACVHVFLHGQPGVAAAAFYAGAYTNLLGYAETQAAEQARNRCLQRNGRVACVTAVRVRRTYCSTQFR